MDTGMEARAAIHTPGPWEADEDGNVASVGGTQIARVLGVDDFPCLEPEDEEEAQAECEANARLIAAAPELVRELSRSHRVIARLAAMVRHYGYAEELPHLRTTERCEALSAATGREP